MVAKTYLIEKKNPSITIDWARWREADNDRNKDASWGFRSGGMGDFDS
jgi:hypothetical protein